MWHSTEISDEIQKHDLYVYKKKDNVVFKKLKYSDSDI